MGANSQKILHVHTDNFPVYDTDDLNLFQKLLNDIMDDCDGKIGSLLSPNEREYLRLQIAAAIFKCAEHGERDYMRLKRRAIEVVSPAPFVAPGP